MSAQDKSKVESTPTALQASPAPFFGRNASGHAGDYLPPNTWKRETFLETYKSSTALLQDGMKLLAYAHGGACIAILSVVGSLTDTCTVAPAVWVAPQTFAFGLIVTIVGYFVGYITQIAFLKWLSAERHDWLLKHIIGFWITFALVAVSVGVFYVGVTKASVAFGAVNCAAPK